MREDYSARFVWRCELMLRVHCFFFQAEDGIRDVAVTGVQTCALPIYVWVALASRKHVHCGVCSAWLDKIESETVVFCRITQMGLLRLLTNPAVMGADRKSVV